MLVSIKGLENKLRSINRTRIVSLSTETVPQMRKTDNPFVGRIVKQSYVSGIIGFRYERAVNGRRLKEAEPQTQADIEAVPEFEALPRSWGQHVEGTPLVEHKGTLYVEVAVQRSLAHQYIIDGLEASADELEQLKAFLPEKTEGARQELDKPIVVRDYKLESVRQLVMDGLTYDVSKGNN